MPNLAPDPSPDLLAELHTRATAAAHHAYAPYSHFFVGVALLLESGEIVTGCNVENASYRLTVCAEQAALVAAVAQHGPRIRIRAVVVANLNHAPCTPCGACRQTLAEFSSPSTLFLFPGPNTTTTRSTLAELLPAAFTLTSSTPA